MGDHQQHTAHEDDALKQQLQSLEAQRDQLVALLGDDTQGHLGQLQAELAAAIHGLQKRLHQVPSPSPPSPRAEEENCLSISVGDVCLAPRVFDRRRARASVESVDISRGTCVVSWIYPRQRRELPCRYWKGGNCKLSGPDCPFSHGVEVSLGALLPDNQHWLTKSSTASQSGTEDASGADRAADWLANLGAGSRVLARYHDRVWYEATAVSPASAESREVAVHFDGFEEDDPVSIPADVAHLAPLDESGGVDKERSDHRDANAESREGAGSSSNDESDIEDAWADTPKTWEERMFPERVLGDRRENTTGGQGVQAAMPTDAYVFGDWEQHTKGFGSRMMSRMGYRRGEGLGKEKQGIARPVSIRVLPERCALDHLRGEDVQSRGANSGNRTAKGKTKVSSATHEDTDEPQKAMFDFLNVTIHAGKASSSAHGGPVNGRIRASTPHSSSTNRRSNIAPRRPVFDKTSAPSCGGVARGGVVSNPTERSAKATTAAGARAADMTRSQLRAHLVGAREAETTLAAKVVRLEETVARNADRDPRTAAQARQKLEEVRAQAREVRASRAKAERVLGDREERSKGGGKGGLFSF